MAASRLLLDAVIATTATVLLAWLASLALRRAGAALRHSVWRLALLAFWMVPPAAIAADALHLQFCPVRVPTPRVVLGDRRAGPAAPERYPLPSWPGVDRPRYLAPRTQPPRGGPLRYPSPFALAVIAWGAGIALSAAYFVGHLRAVADLTRSARPVDDTALSERVAHWFPRVGLPEPPALARSPRLAVPTIVGWRRPLLVLPPAFDADDPSCDAVLVHELAHVSRRDLVAHTAARATRALWWWHPLAWLVDRELHTSAEEACDDWAVALTGQQRTYADYLVRWAEAATTGGVLAYTCGGKTLIERVSRILAQTRMPQLSSSRRARLVLAFCALAAILGAAILRAQPTPTRSTRSSPATEGTMSANAPGIHAELRREGDRVWIEGLEKLQWGGGLSGGDVPQNSYLAALTYALQAMGEDVTYDHVMGVSGAAFRVQMGQPNWCPTAPMAPFGFDCVGAAQKALGISLVDFVAEEPESEAADRAREAAAASIDKGKPALFIRFGWEWELVVGHEGASTALLLRSYGADEDGYSPMEDKPDGFAVTVIGNERSAPDRREVFLRSLAIAVETANTPQYTGGPAGAYASGFAAYEYWIAGLLDDTKWDGLDEDALGGPMHANAHCYNSLVDARQQAGSYLRSVAREFDGDTAAHMRRAADLYGQIHEKLRHRWERVVLPAWQEGTEGWSADMRRAEASALGDALALERQAIEELKAALAVAGKGTEAVGYSGSGSANEVLPQHLVELASKRFADSLGGDYIYQAGLPTAYVQALNHAGVDIDFAEFTALSGWAFSFGYKYDDFSTAYLAVRGTPGGDGPYEAFQIAEWFGLGYESARTEEKDELWAFVQKHINAGTPILSEHYDGGLICGYREHDGKREVWFAVDPPTGKPTWVDINALHPYEVCVLVKKGDPLPKRELYVKGLQRAVGYGIPHHSGGVPQGLTALEAYAADVADRSKDFANCGEYFCWATFERLMARRCAAVWLERAAEELGQFLGLGAAVARYQRAYELYQEYRKAVGGGDPNSGITREQLRSRAKIAQIAPLLRRAINEERAGLHEISVGLAGQGIEPPMAASSAAAAGARQPLSEDLFAMFWPLTRAQAAEWSRLLASPSDLRAALRARSRDYDCTTQERAGSILWLEKDGRVAAMFSIIEDPSDLGVFRGLYRQIQQRGSPLTYAFVRLPSSGPGDTDWHIFRLSAVSYLEHCNHFAVATRDSRPAPAPQRADLFGLFDGMSERARREWAETFASPAAEMASRLQRMAERFSLTQRVQNGFVQWLDRGGEVQAMFRLIPDPRDFGAVRAVYEAVADTACPLTFAVVHQLKGGEGTYDIFRLSPRSYMEHNNRVSVVPPAGEGH